MNAARISPLPVCSLIVLAFLVSCSSFNKGKGTESAPPRIAYVYMSLLFDAASEGTPDLEQIERALQRKIERRERVTESLGKEGTVEAVARNDLKRLDREIRGLRERREKLKERLLKEISTAVDRVAKREKLDFVLTMGEGCIYGRNRYDVTEKVLREMVRLKQRSAPVSR